MSDAISQDCGTRVLKLGVRNKTGGAGLALPKEGAASSAPTNPQSTISVLY